jgi:hypothetical protein
MDVVVRAPRGNQLALTVGASASIDAVKVKIGFEVGLGAGQFDIAFEGELLRGPSLVSACNIRSGSMLLLAINYGSYHVKCRNRDGTFADNRLGTMHVIGKALEHVLCKCYRPAIGALPIPVHMQGPSDCQVVRFADVQLASHWTTETFTVDAAVPAGDGERAIEAAQSVVEWLQDAPRNLEIMTVNHSAGAGAGTSHDLLVAPRAGRLSSLGRGVHSVEVKCRSIRSPLKFDWETELAKEAKLLLDKEVPGSRNRIGFRYIFMILVFLFPKADGAIGTDLISPRPPRSIFVLTPEWTVGPKALFS